MVMLRSQIYQQYTLHSVQAHKILVLYHLHNKSRTLLFPLLLHYQLLLTHSPS